MRKLYLRRRWAENEASKILSRLTTNLQVRPFDFARRADPTQIYNFIQHEHPQTDRSRLVLFGI